MFSHVRIQIHDCLTAPAANAKSINSAISPFVMLDAVFTAADERDREIPTSLLSLIG